MKLKSLLLGSVAAFGFAAVSTAADLPKAAAVQNVQVCDAFGAGFFVIPGTDTCLKISGFVRADYLLHENNATADRWDNAKSINLPAAGALEATDSDTFATRARGQVDIDARTKTEYGPLRGYIRFRTDTRSDSTGGALTTYYHFLQFAGLTAGLAQSQFDFLTYAWLDSYSAGYTMSDRQVNILAYTYTGANGFYATASIEDGNFYDVAAVDQIAGSYANARQDMPDVVLALGVKQAWGSAQLSGIVGQARYISNGVTSDDYRYGVRVGAHFNIDQLAKGDVIAITAAYADGNSKYLGGIDDASHVIKTITTGAGWDVDSVKGWSINGGIKHYWAPNLRSSFVANYASLDYGNVVKTTAAGGTSQTYTDNIFLGQASLIYTPVKNLDLGVEVLYGRREGFTKTSATTSEGRDADTFGAIFRVQRNF